MSTGHYKIQHGLTVMLDNYETVSPMERARGRLNFVLFVLDDIICFVEKWGYNQ